MSQPPIKPFRCIYDPELSQSKSRGTKPLIQKPRLNEKCSDPRVGFATNQTAKTGKRCVPIGDLPPPPFALDIPRKSRVFISGLDPAVNIPRFYDVLRLYDPNADFEIATSKHTGAPLGIAWVEFGPDSREASQRFLSDLRDHRIVLGPQFLDGQSDPQGTLYNDTCSQLDDRVRAENAERELAIRNNELNLLELRVLTRDQMTKWFDKYLGIQATYILIRLNRLALSQASYDHVREVFRNTGYARVGGNSNGIFIVYENEESALRALERNFRRKILGQSIDVALTLSGERIKTSDIKDLYRQRRLMSLKNRKNMAWDPKEPPRDSQTRFPEAALAANSPTPQENDAKDRVIAQILEEAKLRVKSLMFTTKLEPLIQSVVAREFSRHIAEVSSAHPTGNSDDLSSPNQSSLINRDLMDNKTTLQALPESRSLHIPANSFAPNSSAPNTVTLNQSVSKRPVHSAFPKIRIKKHKLDENEPTGSSSTPSTNGAVGNTSPETHSATGVAKVLDRVSIRADHLGRNRTTADLSTSPEPEPLPTPEETSDDVMDIDEDHEFAETSETAESLADATSKGGSMALPDFSQFETSKEPFASTKTIQDFVKLINDEEDFLSLRQALESLEVQPYDDSKMVSLYYQRYGNIEPPYTDIEQPPPGELPYGLTPVLGSHDDERRSYGSGIPMDVVVRYNDNLIREENSSQSKTDHYERATFHLPRSFAKRRSDLFTSNMLTRTAKKTRIARSNIHQWGLYAGEDILADEFVIEYVGDILRSDFADIRERSYDAEGIDSTYLFRLNDDVIIDATKRGNSARFMNHSCDPNCYARIIKFNGIERITLYSKRDIKLDEELTFNYNFAKAINECDRVKCTCGAEICTGWLM